MYVCLKLAVMRDLCSRVAPSCVFSVVICFCQHILLRGYWPLLPLYEAFLGLWFVLSSDPLLSFSGILLIVNNYLLLFKSADLLSFSSLCVNRIETLLVFFTEHLATIVSSGM